MIQGLHEDLRQIPGSSILFIGQIVFFGVFFHALKVKCAKVSLSEMCFNICEKVLSQSVKSATSERALTSEMC